MTGVKYFNITDYVCVYICICIYLQMCSYLWVCGWRVVFATLGHCVQVRETLLYWGVPSPRWRASSRMERSVWVEDTLTQVAPGDTLVTLPSAPVPAASGAVPAPEVWDGAQRVHGEEHSQQLP